MSVSVRAGKIASVVGMDEISNHKGVFSASLWRHVGDEIAATGDVRQRAAEFCCLLPDRNAVSDFMSFVYHTLRIEDEKGEDMIISKVEL